MHLGCLPRAILITSGYRHGTQVQKGVLLPKNEDRDRQAKVTLPHISSAVGDNVLSRPHPDRVHLSAQRPKFRPFL